MSIRKILGNIISWLMITFGGYFFVKGGKNKILSIYFHNPDKEAFESVIKFLKLKGYTFISVSDLYSAIINKIPLSNKTALITLDDAWRDNLVNVVPRAERNGIPITIFSALKPLTDGVLWLKYFRDKDIISRFQSDYPNVDFGKPKSIPTNICNNLISKMKEVKVYNREIMSIEEICFIAKHPLVSVQSHTCSHPILTNCNDNDLALELLDSKKTLEELLNTEIISIAYPNGNYNDKIIEECKKYGYKLAFTTEQKLLDIDTDNLYKLPRFCVPDRYGKYESIARAIGMWNKIFE